MRDAVLLARVRRLTELGPALDAVREVHADDPRAPVTALRQAAA